jgi:hypothetical protein
VTDAPGARLRLQREARGLTLDDLSRTTKISKATLAALESGDVLHLPAPIYTRGFVKAYAREVGLDPMQAADAYLASMEPVRTSRVAPDSVLPTAPKKRHEPRDVKDAARAHLPANQGRRVGRVLLVAIGLGIIAYVWSFNARQASDDNPPNPLPDAALSAVARTGGDIAQTQAADAATAAIADQPPLLELMPRGPCWVSAMVDGKRVFAKLMQAGERHSLAITGEVVLRIGEPGALSYSINGQAGRPFGAPGRPTTVRISKDNFPQFLPS